MPFSVYGCCIARGLFFFWRALVYEFVFASILLIDQIRIASLLNSSLQIQIQGTGGIIQKLCGATLFQAIHLLVCLSINI